MDCGLSDANNIIPREIMCVGTFLPRGEHPVINALSWHVRIEAVARFLETLVSITRPAKEFCKAHEFAFVIAVKSLKLDRMGVDARLVFQTFIRRLHAIEHVHDGKHILAVGLADDIIAIAHVLAIPIVALLIAMSDRLLRVAMALGVLLVDQLQNAELVEKNPPLDPRKFHNSSPRIGNVHLEQLSTVRFEIASPPSARAARISFALVLSNRFSGWRAWRAGESLSDFQMTLASWL
jgi:hypothetical protein